MIYRPATSADGPGMLQLIESHPTGGEIKIIDARRPDAYQSYQTECVNAETSLCVDDAGRILAQLTCLPRKFYIDREICTVGYITGLHKADGAQANIMKLLETGYVCSSTKQFFCSFLDDNQPVINMFAKRGMIHPICEYTTYLFNPAAIKPVRHGFTFRRATPDDMEALLRFYSEVGSGYSYFPVISSLDDFAGLTVSDFFILEDGDSIAAAGALWNQKYYKQYIVLGYDGAYKFAALCNPILRALHYPPLPKVNAAAHFAYVSFLLCRENDSALERILLGEISAAARNYNFLTIGAVKRTALGQYFDSVKNIKIGSRLCAIDFNRNGMVESFKMPLRFECALL
jgi:hypothetical protein